MMSEGQASGAEAVAIEINGDVCNFRRTDGLGSGEINTENQVSTVHVPVLSSIRIKLAGIEHLSGYTIAEVNMTML